MSLAQHQQGKGCELCGENHSNGQCAMQRTSQEEVSYMSNQGYQGNFNQEWRPHQNMGQSGPSNRPPTQPSYHHPSLTDRTSKLDDMMQQFLQMSIQNQRNTDTSIKNLEVQVGQLADQRGSSFSANTEVNPKEQCKVIFTRSGKEVGLGSKEKVEVKEKKKNEEEIQEEEVDEEIVAEEEENKSEEKRQKDKVVVKPLPYPQNPSRKEKEKQLAQKTYSSNLRSSSRFLKHCNKYLLMQSS